MPTAPRDLSVLTNAYRVVGFLAGARWALARLRELDGAPNARLTVLTEIPNAVEQMSEEASA